jgi:hypothetical protein
MPGEDFFISGHVQHHSVQKSGILAQYFFCLPLEVVEFNNSQIRMTC